MKENYNKKWKDREERKKGTKTMIIKRYKKKEKENKRKLQ